MDIKSSYKHNMMIIKPSCSILFPFRFCRKSKSSSGSRISRWGGAPTSDVGTFRQKRMQKRKNWILLGGRQRRPPGSANEKAIPYDLHHAIHLAKRLDMTRDILS